MTRGPGSRKATRPPDGGVIVNDPSTSADSSKVAPPASLIEASAAANRRHHFFLSSRELLPPAVKGEREEMLPALRPGRVASCLLALAAVVAFGVTSVTPANAATNTTLGDLSPANPAAN